MMDGNKDFSLRPPYRELEFWAAALAVTPHVATFDEIDLEHALSIGLDYSSQTMPAHAKCLAQYVIGRAVLLLRDSYPEWREWVAHAAVLAGAWAEETEDQALHDRCEALFTDYISLIRAS